MKILVTGAAGFVGSHVASMFIEQGHKVLGVDSFSNYYNPNLKNQRVDELIPDSSRMRNVELSDSDAVQILFKEFQPELVVHLAAQAGVRLSISQNSHYVRDNLVAFSNVLEQTVLHQIPNFMYASSSSVYGNSEMSPFTETQRDISPISFYGATKLANELLANALTIGTHTMALGLRFFTVYGPWGRPDMAYFRIAASLTQDYEFSLFGDGSLRRDFTYIDDVVRAVNLLAIKITSDPGLKSQVVNIGGGNPRSMSELIQCFESHSEKKLQLRQVKGFESDVVSTIADGEKLKSLINYLPGTSLEKGAEEVMRWANRVDIKRNLISWIEN